MPKSFPEFSKYSLFSILPAFFSKNAGIADIAFLAAGNDVAVFIESLLIDKSGGLWIVTSEEDIAYLSFLWDFVSKAGSSA